MPEHGEILPKTCCCTESDPGARRCNREIYVNRQLEEEGDICSQQTAVRFQLIIRPLPRKTTCSPGLTVAVSAEEIGRITRGGRGPRAEALVVTLFEKEANAESRGSMQQRSRGCTQLTTGPKGTHRRDQGQPDFPEKLSMGNSRAGDITAKAPQWAGQGGSIEEHGIRRSAGQGPWKSLHR